MSSVPLRSALSASSPLKSETAMSSGEKPASRRSSIVSARVPLPSGPTEMRLPRMSPGRSYTRPSFKKTQRGS